MRFTTSESLAARPPHRDARANQRALHGPGWASVAGSGDTRPGDRRSEGVSGTGADAHPRVDRFAAPTDAPFAARSIFAATSFWNAAVPEEVALAADDVAGKPVNPTVGAELAAFAKRKDGSTNTWINYRAFTAPITTVPANAPLEPVRLCRSYPSGCVPSWAASLDRTLRGVAERDLPGRRRAGARGLRAP